MTVTARGVRASLGRAEVLRGVDLVARPGEVTAIVGPNGSGKTTLLRALTGEIEHRGEVRVNGHAVAGMPAWQLAGLRAVLPQATPLAFPFTVYEVVRLGLTTGTGSGGDVPSRALAAVGLAGFEGRFFQELSGGEQQRAQLARVLAQVWRPVVDGAPRWLFLDEPVASLDIGHQLQVLQLVRRYAAAGGGAIVVMHDLNLTAMFASSVVLVDAGRVEVQGTPGEVLADAHLSRAYGCRLRVNTPPAGPVPYVLPHSASVDDGAGAWEPLPPPTRPPVVRGRFVD